MSRAPLPALALGLLVLGAADAALASSCPVPRAAPRFVHRDHFALKDWSAEAYPCERCHSVAGASDRTPPSGATQHKNCNEAQCHADGFNRFDGRLCLSCHLEKSRVPERAKALQPFPREPAGFYVEMDHAAHFGKDRRKPVKDGCFTCHASKMERPGHAQCEACHDAASEKPMAQCGGCHLDRLDAEGRPHVTGPRGRPNPCRVTKAFSHENHATDRRRGKGARKLACSTCHFGVEKATNLAALVPTHGPETMLKGCGSCHDGLSRDAKGQPLFAITGSCTSCHETQCLTSVPTPSWHGATKETR